MKKGLFQILFCLFILSLAGCKNEFEKLRASSDAETLYAKAFEYYDNEEYNRAQILFEQVLNSFRGREEAEKVYFYYANSHFYQQKYLLASYYYKNFAQTFTNSDYREEAEFLSAYSNYKMSPSYRLDQSSSIEAIEGFQLFVNTYPNSERIKECNALIDELRGKLEEKAFQEANLYYNLKEYQSARKSFDNVLTDFPETDRAEQIKYLIIKSGYELAMNSVRSKQEDRLQTMIDDYNTFTSRYPKSKYRRELRTLYNNSTSKLKEISDE